MLPNYFIATAAVSGIKIASMRRNEPWTFPQKYFLRFNFEGKPCYLSINRHPESHETGQNNFQLYGTDDDILNIYSPYVISGCRRKNLIMSLIISSEPKPNFAYKRENSGVIKSEQSSKIIVPDILSSIMTESATALASNLPDNFVGLFSTGMAFSDPAVFMRETNPVPMPTVILAVWHNNKVNPSRELPKKPAPTAPAMKSGPELLQKARSLSACSRVRSLFSYKSAVYLAPAGYPLNHPAIRGNAALPGRLNTGFIKGSNTLPIVYIAPVSRISLETTKTARVKEYDI